MKKFIRRWLGIEALEERIQKTDTPVSETQLRKMVGSAVVAALKGQADEKWSDWYADLADVKNTLISAIEGAAGPYAVERSRREVQRLTGTEAFIDSVVDRIRKKQI